MNYRRYILANRDRSIVFAAKSLLWKIVRSTLVSVAQLEHVARVLAVLERMPEASDDLDVIIELTSPRRWFGEHEIWHWWDVSVDGELVEVRSGGHFYRKSTGGDSFSSMQWSASPEIDSELYDYVNALGIVDDAMPFESEVGQIDLNEDGFSITVSVEGEKIDGLNDIEEDNDGRAAFIRHVGDWEELHNYPTATITGLSPQGRGSIHPTTEPTNVVLENKWTRGKVHFSISPLPPHHLGTSGALFQPGIFDKEVGEETALIILDDPQFACELGALNPFNLTATTGLVRTSAGTIAYIVWVISSSQVNVVDYEHLLNPFDAEAVRLLTDIAQQTHLKVLIVDSSSSNVVGSYDFLNSFDLGELAALITEVVGDEPVADFASTQAALRAEFSLKELKGL